VGNLYLNRKCTGAMVGRASLWRVQHVRHRFQRPAARITLLLFTQAKSVAEKIGDAGPISDDMNMKGRGIALKFSCGTVHSGLCHTRISSRIKVVP